MRRLTLPVQTLILMAVCFSRNPIMTEILSKILASAPVVPLVSSNDPNEAVATSAALLDGGMQVLEVVLRTDAAFECLRAITRTFPDAQVGAGTVLSDRHAKKAIEYGAKFIVSPGLHESVVRVAQGNDMPVLPGIATATELQQAWNMGLRTVKFFPADLSGGPKMLKALSSVFRDVSFMPTGGVNESNLSEYLDIPAVIACGGSWLTPSSSIAVGDFKSIETMARQALAIAKCEG